jgi:hypothetical protein
MLEEMDSPDSKSEVFLYSPPSPSHHHNLKDVPTVSSTEHEHERDVGTPPLLAPTRGENEKGLGREEKADEKEDPGSDFHSQTTTYERQPSGPVAGIFYPLDFGFITLEFNPYFQVLAGKYNNSPTLRLDIVPFLKGIRIRIMLEWS